VNKTIGVILIVLGLVGLAPLVGGGSRKPPFGW
jgi:hypothetical protein